MNHITTASTVADLVQAYKAANPGRVTVCAADLRADAEAIKTLLAPAPGAAERTALQKQMARRLEPAVTHLLRAARVIAAIEAAGVALVE